MKKIRVFFAVLMFVSGIGIALYPFISDMFYQRNASRAIENYQKSVENLDKEKIDAAKEAARKYNEQLSSAIVRDENGEAEEGGNSYVDMIDVGEILGYITIPKIDVNLPIYNGTGADVLQKGVGHMVQSSYPLGGESTHCVLTGHRGLPEAVLFTYLDRLERGDCFYLHVLDEVLAYRVERTKVVEPNEGGDLDIVPGQDLCTLVTCTPYSINTHRLLVTGVRTTYEGEEEESEVRYQEMRTGTAAQRLVEMWPWMAAALTLVIGTEGVIMVLMIRKKRRRDRDE